MSEENRPPSKPGPLAKYEDENLPLKMAGNVYINGALPHEQDLDPLVLEQVTTDMKMIQKEDGLYLEWNLDPKRIKKQKSKYVTTELLGRAGVPNMRFENPDGSPITINTDYFDNS